MTQRDIALMIGGILVVFLVLGLLILCITILGKIMVAVEKRKASKAPAAAADPCMDGAFVAAVTATINKVNPVEEGRSIRIKNIRKV